MSIWPHITLIVIQSSLLFSMDPFGSTSINFINNYEGQQKERAPIAQVLFGTPARAQLSQEFNNIRLSTIACTYSPSQECRDTVSPDSSTNTKIELTESCLLEINDIKDFIIGEWKDAQEKIKNADTLLQADNLSFEERNHYRAECLIMGLNTLYKYRNMIIAESELHEHQYYMTTLLLSARIALALSYTINTNQFPNDSIEKKCTKLSTKLNVCDAIQINEQHAIKLPTMPINIKKSLQLSELP